MPLSIHLTITKKDPDADSEEIDEESLMEAMSKSLNAMDLLTEEEKADDDHIYKMDVKSKGKFTRKATWEDMSVLAGYEVDSEKMADWIDSYHEQCFPQDLEKPNHRPEKCWIGDDAKKGYTAFKDYDWTPVKLQLKPGMVDIKEKYTKPVVLKEFLLDYSTDKEKLFQEFYSQQVVSTLTKSKLAGHALTSVMGTLKSEVNTIFTGLETKVFSLGNESKSVVDEETGAETWTDSRSLGKLLRDQPLPEKTGTGNNRNSKAIALESYVKARVYYKTMFTGEVATDHTEDKFDGIRYHNFPLKYLLQYNDVGNAIILYEDIELKFYTDVHIAASDKEFEWGKDDQGQWMKSYSNFGGT